MDEMEFMFTESTEQIKSATKRNSKSTCSSDYASCITCTCNPPHEYDSQTSVASEVPDDDQNFQVEFVNCSTPTSVDNQDENQSLNEECVDNVDSASSVHDEQTAQVLRKSPRKTAILSGTYKIRGKQLNNHFYPKRAKGTTSKGGRLLALNTSCPSNYLSSLQTVEADKLDGSSRKFFGESSISCWDVHENVEPAKFTPYLNDDGCKEQSVSCIPAVDPMIYEGKFPILRLDRVDRLLSKTDTYAVAVPSEDNHSSFAYDDRSQGEWHHQGNVEKSISIDEKDENRSLGEDSDQTVSSCRGTEYFMDFKSSRNVEDSGAVGELEPSSIVSEVVDSAVRRVEKELKANFCKELRQLLTKYEDNVDVPSKIETPQVL